MNEFELIVPCHFGMEAVLKREIIDLGYEISKVEDGRVTFAGDAEAVCYANIFLRSAERILIKVGEFKAETFTELFDNTASLPWEEFIPKNGKFWVTKAASVKSKLFSPSDIQSIMKKAMVKRLESKYGISLFPEDGDDYPVRVFIKNDIVTVGLDTTGVSLHKRGYRKLTAKAPIAENLAAGLIMLTPYNKDRVLMDPFCGSGTIPIEAALMAINKAPGMERQFTANKWTHLIPKKEWIGCIDDAKDRINLKVETEISGNDIDPEMIKIAQANARMAGVDKYIRFTQKPVADMSHDKKYGFIITNPPYGERLEEKENLYTIYNTLYKRYIMLDDWSMYLITSYENAEKDMGKQSDKNRKIYNGMIKTYFLSYIGAKPPKQH